MYRFICFTYFLKREIKNCDPVEKWNSSLIASEIRLILQSIPLFSALWICILGQHYGKSLQRTADSRRWVQAIVATRSRISYCLATVTAIDQTRCFTTGILGRHACMVHSYGYEALPTMYRRPWAVGVEIVRWKPSWKSNSGED